MKITFITLFPDMIQGYFATSMMKKASDNKAAEFGFINLRDFGIGPRKQVDDSPFGGGSGMVLKPEPIYAAVEQAQKLSDGAAKVILMTPRGEPFAQHTATELADSGGDLILVCARYEGYDERITDIIDMQICLGPFVMTGGELPAACVADAVVRLLPGVLGGENSAMQESFTKSADYIEHPQYTRPASFRGQTVPEVLLSGNHGEVDSYRASS